MINSVSAVSSSYNSSSIVSAKIEINDDFISKLNKQFNNDEIDDPVQASIGASKDIDSLVDQLGGSGDVIRIEDIEESIRNDFSNFKAMLDSALEKAGISKDPSFEVKSDSAGKLYINSDHPDKDKIEKILNEVPNIRDTYMGMSANSSLVAAAKRAEAFNSAYEINPESAVQKYSYLFDKNSCDIFSIFVSDEEYKPSLTFNGNDEKLKVFDDIMNS